MDRETKSSLDNPATKKKPPKLKSINRSISMAIDNYTPAPQMIIDDSLILEEPPPPPPLALAPAPPAPLLPLPLAKFPQPDIYLVSGAGSTSPIKYDDWHPMKKPMFRRSDTIDIHPSSTLQMKKTHSFHANEPTMEQIMLTTGSASSSRRTSSVRGNYLFPQTSTKEISRSPSPSRRGCRTHRSFNDPSRRPSVKTEADAIRHPSLNDDILESSRPPPLFSTTNLSLENELFTSSNRSRSNSHAKIEDQRLSFEETAIAGSSNSISSRKHHARQHSSHSLELEKQHEAQHHNHHLLPSASISPSQPQPGQSHSYHFKRGGKHAHSLYLSPNNLEELQIHRPNVVQQGATKKSHSASVRVRTYREALSASKKSKSFMGDAYPEFDLSPHRRNSRPLTTVSGDIGGAVGVTIEDIKRSPRPMVASTSGRLIEEKRPSFERKTSLSYEIGEAAAFDQVLRPFRHPVRRTSMTGSSHKLKKKSLSDDTDEDEESDRKRKRIVCIIMTVFLCLVCASVFVVIITLTHSSVPPGQNTSKKIYTFSRETPVHYNVRQENERLMQESINRARFAKNFTDAASLSATAEQIP